MSAFERIFVECERAISEGNLIERVSVSDKEFHFQNWVRDRFDSCGLTYLVLGRNTYPDFPMADSDEGFEVKGLAQPGRKANYDANSQMPMPTHDGREVFYIFGRYPKEISGLNEYPVTDLVVCHGSFLNPDSAYVHENRSFRGFGSFGDILVRDRKMYVVPTPFALVDGIAGFSTLIVPEYIKPKHDQLIKIGEIVRVEADQVVASYEFNLQTNEMVTHPVPNPLAGKEHKFSAYRVKGRGDSENISLSANASAYADRMKLDHE